MDLPNSRSRSPPVFYFHTTMFRLCIFRSRYLFETVNCTYVHSSLMNLGHSLCFMLIYGMQIIILWGLLKHILYIAVRFVFNPIIIQYFFYFRKVTIFHLCFDCFFYQINKSPIINLIKEHSKEMKIIPVFSL